MLEKCTDRDGQPALVPRSTRRELKQHMPYCNQLTAARGLGMYVPHHEVVAKSSFVLASSMYVQLAQTQLVPQ